MKYFRLTLARNLTKHLPPILASRVRDLVYPRRIAQEEDVEAVGRLQTGSLFRGRTSDFHANAVIVHGYFDWKNLAIALAICEPDGRIIEIGSHIGTETIGFSDIVREGEVFAFEPFPQYYQVLKANLQINDIQNVFLSQLALSDRARRMSFVVPIHTGTGHILQENETQVAVNTIDVECVTLDALESQLGTCDLLFIDAEGEEIRILRGGANFINTHRPTMVLEFSPPLLERSGFSPQEFVTEISSIGYKLLFLDRIWLRDFKVAPDEQLNCLCIPKEKMDSVRSIQRKLWQCGLRPCIRGINPLILSSRRR